MRLDIERLKDKVLKSGMTQEAFATAIGMDKSTLYRKMKTDGLEFSIKQMHDIADVLHLSYREACEIFLSEPPYPGGDN